MDSAKTGTGLSATTSSSSIAVTSSVFTNSRARKRYWSLLVIVWAISALYGEAHLKRGWWPRDEGAFSQSALRVLNGEIPHRDFDEIYTGGLAYLHALAFRAIGINLASMRYILFVFFLAWVPAVFYVASRFMSGFVAAGITVLAVAWSVPNYSGVPPSWYNLYFAVFGTAALLHYLQVRTRRWLFLAGLCGGLSILAKVVGVFYVAAVVLFLIYHEQCVTKRCNERSLGPARLYTWTIASGLTIFLLALVNLVHKLPGAPQLIHFVLPTAALVVLLLWRELAGVPGFSGERFATLLRLILPFAIGVAIPILVFLIPYIRTGSLHALFNGVFVLPMKRFHFASFPAPAALALTPSLFIAFVIFLASNSVVRWRQLWGIVSSFGLGTILVVSANTPFICRVGWDTLGPAIPVIVLAGVALLVVSWPGWEFGQLRREQLMLVLCVTALSNIVQFPYSVRLYFFFVAPLAILCGAAVLASLPRPPGFVLGSLGVFYLLFVVLRVTPCFFPDMGLAYIPAQFVQLSLPRAGGLYADVGSAQTYEKLIPAIQMHAVAEYTYATPDCSEVYFLSGLRNPTRTLYDFLDEPADRDARILQVLESHNVNVVAINNRPQFSTPINPALKQAFEERYPQSVEIGPFEVRWRR